MAPPQVNAQRFDFSTGLPIGAAIPIGLPALDPAVSLLDPAGNRLVIVSSDFALIEGNILDVSVALPSVGAAFPVSVTPGTANGAPSVAADPASGGFLVAWENVTGAQGDPVNVRARRFRLDGRPGRRRVRSQRHDCGSAGSAVGGVWA